MRFWTTKKVLVTGGCGLIGSHLVERLLVAGTKVCVAEVCIDYGTFPSLG